MKYNKLSKPELVELIHLIETKLVDVEGEVRNRAQTTPSGKRACFISNFLVERIREVNGLIREYTEM